jgi:hypothetical protein
MKVFQCFLIAVATFFAVVTIYVLLAGPAESEEAPGKVAEDTRPLPPPPLHSMAVTQCKKIVAVWVVLADGNVVRFDKDHKPTDEAEFKRFIDWLDSGPHDIYEMACPIST